MHHGGDTVAHCALVAPVVESRGGVRTCWIRREHHALAMDAPSTATLNPPVTIWSISQGEEQAPQSSLLGSCYLMHGQTQPKQT